MISYQLSVINLTVSIERTRSNEEKDKGQLWKK